MLGWNSPDQNDRLFPILLHNGMDAFFWKKAGFTFRIRGLQGFPCIWVMISWRSVLGGRMGFTGVRTYKQNERNAYKKWNMIGKIISNWIMQPILFKDSSSQLHLFNQRFYFSFRKNIVTSMLVKADSFSRK